ncbi:hypothetical protein AA977_02715 [Helicobacter pylori]|uniref:Uncharacterized protein n=1 Tax=Helicobacter pylori TaxID=210 RepID=A0A1A9HEC9_HELPX|nr:hypothetical protein AA977_02715 [Helicobacter pylori]
MAIYLGNILQYSSSEACINLDLPCTSCYKLGLPNKLNCSSFGGLLPHPFTLTLKRRFAFCGTFP